MTQSRIIDVAIIEDKADIREKWRKFINNNGTGMSCTLTYSSVESAVRNLAALKHADVILMDIGLPGVSGIEGTRILKDELIDVDIIILTVEQDDETIFEALKNGAVGYFVKQYITNDDDLLTGIREVSLLNGSAMSANIARKVCNFFKKYGTVNTVNNGITYFKELTPSQNRALDLLANEGYSNKQIADVMSLSVETVRAYCKQIYKVLNVENRVQAALRAHGIK